MTFDKIFNNQTSNTNSSTLDWDGGEGQVIASGTWDSGKVSLEISPDSGTTWVSVGTDGELTADGVFSFRANPCKVRLAVSSAGASTSLNAWITSEEYGSSRV
jgi:hypothetical protein